MLRQKCFLILFVVSIWFHGCSIRRDLHNKPTPIPSFEASTLTIEIVPSLTVTSSLPAPTNTLQSSPTPDYWWEQQETIAFTSPDWKEIILAGLDRSQEIYPTDLVVSPPVWSPDGTKVAFFTWKEIFLLDIYTGKYEQLTNINDDELHIPSWSPDGTEIAFPSSKGIHIYSLDGKEILHLSSPDYNRVVWSPDGQHLVIEILKKGKDFNIDLLFYSFSTQRILPIAETGFYEGMPSWSPDSQKIVYSRDGIGEVSNLFVYDIGRGETEQLTNNFGINFNPEWSPNGNMITFRHRDESSQTDIYIISSSGGEPIQISNFAGTESWPVWSSDGKKIAFEYIGDPNDEDELNAGKVPIGLSGIWIYDFDSGLFTFIEGSEGGLTPAWRP